MSVATIGDDELPDARVVLARGVDERGFVFYTNLESAKAQQVASRPVAAATFAWLSFHRQVRLRGVVEPVQRRRGRSLLPQPPEGVTHRRVGLAPIPCSRRSRRARRAGGCRGCPVPRTTTFPGRRTGVACASCRPPSSSGRAGPAACTTVSATAARPGATPGSSSASRRESIRPTGGAGSFAGGRAGGSLGPHIPAIPGDDGVHQGVDQGLGVRVQAGPFPVPEQWGGTAHARRQLQLHAAASSQVDRVPRVKSAQLDGDGVDVGDHLVCR